MTGMLASVKNIEEALMVLAAKVDIIDLKQPEHGALGALDTDVVREIVDVIQNRCLVSATIGDLPMQSGVLSFAAQVMATTGVDYIKIGFFPEGDWLSIVDKLAALTPENKLIAVLFADAKPDLEIIKALKIAGFTGVMLDTLNKRSGSLTKVMAIENITQFVSLAQQEGLLCGLAGSLRVRDVAGLRDLEPDYLGFRGGLCAEYERTGQLNQAAIIKVLKAVKTPIKKKLSELDKTLKQPASP